MSKYDCVGSGCNGDGICKNGGGKVKTTTWVLVLYA